VRQWYSTPEPCVPTPHALRLFLPPKPEQKAAMLERLTDTGQWLFLDIETTGLAGGTGTYAFLVGIAWWEAGGLQVEQFFMRDYTQEHSLLLEVSRRLAERGVLVTFNGKSFDWPLLETRYLMTRSISPRPPATHLDLLHPARQLWRLRLGSVRLTELERHVLGPDHLGWDRRDDIDSALIPQVYFDYLHGGPMERLRSVFRHNQLDLRGLAALAARMLALLSAPETAGEETHALELYGLSRLLSRRGQESKARLLYERALGAGLPIEVECLAQRELARLAKRGRDFARANALWEELACHSVHLRRSPPRHAARLQQGKGTTVRGLNHALETSLEAYEQLAIYYEHHSREPSRATELTREALEKLRRGVRSSRIEFGPSRRWEARLEHRLARLARSAKTREARPLFDSASAEANSQARESNPRSRSRGHTSSRLRDSSAIAG
jgi:uncharacterized protein YprB with RNaseH-like and TPR domain